MLCSLLDCLCFAEVGWGQDKLCWFVLNILTRNVLDWPCHLGQRSKRLHNETSASDFIVQVVQVSGLLNFIADWASIQMQTGNFFI